MIPRLLLSVLTALLFGGALLAIVRPGAIRRLPIFLTLGLAVGLGVGLTSCFFFLWKVVGGNRGTIYVAVEIALLVLTVIVAVVRLKRQPKSEASPVEGRSSSPWPTVICLVLLGAALTAFAFQCLQQPK